MYRILIVEDDEMIVIFLSSAADKMNIVMAVNMGGDDFIAKPFDLDVLTAKIQAMLRRSYDFVSQSVVLEHKGTMRQQNMLVYYSMWVHQIKTPIAALKLLIDEDLETYFDRAQETEENDTCVIKEQQKQQELFGIEQYADMALQYTCLGAESNDFVLEQVVLDEVIKHSVRKYVKQFIHKKLQLCYEPREIRVVTDRKWLGFVVD